MWRLGLLMSQSGGLSVRTSGVTSRGAKPVPPVVRMRFSSSSSHHSKRVSCTHVKKHTLRKVTSSPCILFTGDISGPTDCCDGYRCFPSKKHLSSHSSGNKHLLKCPWGREALPAVRCCSVPQRKNFSTGSHRTIRSLQSMVRMFWSVTANTTVQAVFTTYSTVSHWL